MPTTIQRLSAAVTDIRTIMAAVISLVVAAFTAGSIYSGLLNRISLLEADISIIRKRSELLEGENVSRRQQTDRVQAELARITTEINGQFARLVTGEIKNIDGVIQNMLPPNGSGYNPASGQGHCEAGAFVVGIQPMQGASGISFQCAKLPILNIK